MERELLFTETTQWLTEVTLNNEKKMNHLTYNMLCLMLERLIIFDREPDKAPRVMLTSGAGNVAYCSGGDMKGLYDAYIGIKPKIYQSTYTGTLYRMDYALATMKPIHVAIWNGYVFGSGAGHCMRALFTVGTDNTEWAMPECVAGFIVDNGASHFFAHLRNDDIALGLYLAVTGQRVAGRNMRRFGLCSHFVPRAKLDALREDLVRSVNSKTTKQDVRDILDKHAELDLERELPDNYEMI
jgi:enoyl-CoA hydratase/carnithine racemase